MISPENTERLSEAGAGVDLRWRDTGHDLTYEEVAEAKGWLEGILPELDA